MGYVVAAWLAAGIVLAGYGWSIRHRRRAVAAEAAADAAEEAADNGAADGSDDAADGGAPAAIDAGTS